MEIELHDVRVPAIGPSGQDWKIAATIFLPLARDLASEPNLLFLLPGGGYGRGYYNLPVAGFSQAMYHAGRGTLVVTLDYVGAGESSAPEAVTFDEVAASTHYAVTHIANQLAAGTLLWGLGPVEYGAMVGAGQSLGGHVLAATQGNHHTFSGIATLGANLAGTQFPQRDGSGTADMSQVDWPYAFHWPEVKPIDPATTPTDLDTLIAVDVAIGTPQRMVAAPWASLTVPSFGMDALAPGVSAAYAAKVESPVLVAVGERDVTLPLEDEVAAFSKAAGVQSFVLPQSAHMHNFSETREQLWERLDAFVTETSTPAGKAANNQPTA